ncbi:UNVERIFIED_CONTAM: hypothetical protein PYX00_008346 [Menopon gallinae]|uniref:Beta-galactosidase n=1 Tax=Menopon gallinae TaxID=328185 RepID=A0AAW2HMI3_9NEOP
MVRIEAVLVVAAVALAQLQLTNGRFTINYEKNTFEMDGKPFRYVSASLHYFRIPREYWRDRLRKVRAAGLNAISTYVEWSQHEAKPGTFDFSDNLDLPHFVRLAQEENLFVILRPGPYICAEREMGGLPYWLLREHPDIYLRTNDRNYTKYVERWLNVLMTTMSPLLNGRGGPIIMVQVENEYGSYKACDKKHLLWLRDVFTRHTRNDAVLFTTDGASSQLLKCGKIPGVYATIDFGAGVNVKKMFEVQRHFEPRGPLVNSEFYTGWFTHWGEKMARVDTRMIIKSLRDMLDLGANINIYMFHGGTNFGFTAGANLGKTYTSDITSYDYDAPISEAGDLTDKYFAIMELLSRYIPLNNISVSTGQKGNYGEVSLTPVASFLSPKVKYLMGNIYKNNKPLSFEALNQNYGYLLYETDITFEREHTILEIPQVKDYANVFINGMFKGNLSRELATTKLRIPKVKRGDKLSIIVENLGRVNYGPFYNDTKGILSNVYLGGKVLTKWNMTSYEFKDTNFVEYCSVFGDEGINCLDVGGYTFYVGYFSVPESEENCINSYPLDSFLDVSTLTKGIVFINNINLGRYWSTRGPQYSLYVPGVYLKPAPRKNTIVIMDEYIAAPGLTVNFSDTPISSRDSFE